MKLRHYEIVQDSDKLKVDLQEVFMKYKTIKQWAYIEHNRCDTRPHYHIYINFGGSSVESELVAKWFNLGYVNDKGEEKTGENFIRRVTGRKADMLAYLTHENAPHKVQYSRDEVTSNFKFALEIEKAKILGDFKNYSYAQQLDYVHSLPLDEQTQAFAKLEKLWKIECQHRTLNPERQMQVIFITGKGGTGKTYYAKKLLTSMKLDFCISSSSNDPFQDYLGQKAIILDDLRDKAFINANGTDNFEDLLKILDNNTSSSVRSRFSNKVFNGEVIVITSSVPLCYWFSAKKGTSEDLQQLYRRISVYVHMTDKVIEVYSQIDRDGKPCGPCKSYVNEVAELKQKPVEHKDLTLEFDKICTAINLPPVVTYVQDELPF